jgi:hypothetical protein
MRSQTHLRLQTPRGQHSIVPRRLPWGKSRRYLMSFRRPHQIASFHPNSQILCRFYLRQVYPRANAMMAANRSPGSAVPVRYFSTVLIDDPDLSKFLLGATAEFRRLHSRSSPRPSLASVNVLLLHSATLRPVSERRTSTRSSRRSAAGSHVVDPDDDDDNLSALPSSLPTTCPQDISLLPSFPETATNPSAATSSGFPSSSSPPSSPDFLDSIILADESRRTRREYSLLSVNHWTSDDFVQNGAPPAKVYQRCPYLVALKLFPRHLLSSALCSHQVLVARGGMARQFQTRRRDL